MSPSESETPTTENLAEFMKVCETAARAGGQRLLDWLGKANVSEKSPRDFVTDADYDAQKVIQEILQSNFPDHGFVGEESKGAAALRQFDGDDHELNWVVDPLDGTMNFIHQLRSFAVSIALCQGERPLVGCVFDPLLDESYCAIAGMGASLNGNPIRPSRCQSMPEALMVVSLPAAVTADHPQVKRFLNVVGRAASVRRLGSAALNLCYVACGRTDGYWAVNLKAWDVAAGWLILREAGGNLCDFDGNAPQLFAPTFCATSTPELSGELLPLLRV